MTETLTVATASAAMAAAEKHQADLPARAALASAKAARDDLIRRAVAGEAISPAAHRKAVDAVRTAEQDDALDAAVAEGRRLTAERERIDALHGEATAIKAKLRAAVAADAAAAAALDEAVAGANLAAARAREAAAALRDLEREALCFNDRVDSEVPSNGTLAAIHTSTRPKLRTANIWQVPAHPLRVAIVLPEAAARAAQLAGPGYVAIARSAASLASGAHQAVLHAIGAAPDGETAA